MNCEKGKNMNEFEFNLIKNFPGFDDNSEYNFEEVNGICEVLRKYFNFSSFDVMHIIFKCPTILKCSKDDLVQNIQSFSYIFNLKSSLIKYFVLRYPFVLTIRNELINYKIKLVATLLSVSLKDAIKVIYLYPDVMFLSKTKMKQKIKMFATNLDEFGFGLRKIFKANPNALFVEDNKICEIKEIFMKGFTLSSTEACRVIKTSPEILSLSREELLKKLNMLYPRYFVKRDIKEILPYFPAILNFSEKEFYQRIFDIQKLFDFDTKGVSTFIIQNPEVLFIDNINKKVEGLKKFNINIEYLKLNPYLLSCLEITLPIKFILTRILSIDNLFIDVCKMNTRLFLARFLFMQTNGHYNHNDLVISEDEFYQKYNISSKMLILNYKIERENIENICNYYVSLKKTLTGWTDVIFPSDKQFQEFIVEKDNTCEENMPTFAELRNNNLIGKRDYEVYKIFNKKHINFGEYKMILKKCPSLKDIDTNNFLKIFEIIRKNGLSYEDCIKAIFKYPHLFTYSVKDFDYILQQKDESNESFIEILKSID